MIKNEAQFRVKMHLLSSREKAGEANWLNYYCPRCQQP
jgi:hypothetical protein